MPMRTENDSSVPLDSTSERLSRVRWVMISFALAATIINYHTVHFALSRRGALRTGESLLVLDPLALPE